MQLKRLAFLFVVIAGLVTAGGAAFAADPENTMIITLKDGDVTIALRPDLAPKHVAQIKALAREGAYDNVAFHRVIDGFMAQTGDVQFGDMNDGFDANLAGTGGSDKADLPAEFSQEHYVRGTVGMARAQSPEFGQFAVLHHVRAGAAAGRPVHRRWHRRKRHGTGRQDQEGRSGAKRGCQRPRSHDQGPHRRGRQLARDHELNICACKS